MCDYVVSCSYYDVVLIICMLHDYINMLDEIKADDVFYQAYYRGQSDLICKFLSAAFLRCPSHSPRSASLNMPFVNHWTELS